MIRPLALLVCAFSILFVPSAALAKPKVALTEIEGDTRGDVRAAVAAALDGKELSLVNAKEVNRAVAKVGKVADLTEPDLKKLATTLEADAIVLAKLEREGGTKSLKFRLYVNQAMVKGFTVSFKDPKSPKFRTLLHDKMVEKIGSAEDADDADEAEPEPVAAKPTGSAAKPAKPEDTKPPKAEDAEPSDTKPSDAGSRKATKQVAAVDKTERLEVRSSTAAAHPRSANLIPIRVDVGVSAVRRSFAFDTTMAGNPKDVSSSPGPGVRVGAEAYPLVLTMPASPLARLGLAVEYDKTFASKVTDAPVSQSHFSIGLRYRHAFGTSALSPTLTAGVGFGKWSFSPDGGDLDAAAQTELAKSAPASDLTVIDPGVAFRYPLNPRFAIVVAARGLLITGAGAIQEAASYGSGTAYGIDADLGLDIVLGKRFVARVAGELTQIGYSFNGDGALADNVGGLTDRSLGGTATLGVLY
ncbi:MAG: hypothetical protein H7138_18805 [Myxococcales bacterium]|nr:hypothetical protein [Myxococcales bacterium]